MDKYTNANRKNWDGRVPVHMKSRFYDVAGFKRGRTSLKRLEIAELGDVKGKSLLHLQCHFGLDTLSWARLGARVVGVDFSGAAIAAARALSRETGIPAEFIKSDICAMPEALEKKFDIVFASYGVICWISDMRRWMKVAVSRLKPGGVLYLLDDHPFICTFKEDGRSIKYPYFPGKPIKGDGGATYTDGVAKDLRETYEWQHSLGEIVNSAVENGLVIEFLHEFDFCAWKRFRNMEKGRDGLYRIPGLRPALPLMFSLKARCPGS